MSTSIDRNRDIIPGFPNEISQLVLEHLSFKQRYAVARMSYITNVMIRAVTEPRPKIPQEHKATLRTFFRFDIPELFKNSPFPSQQPVDSETKVNNVFEFIDFMNSLRFHEISQNDYIYIPYCNNADPEKIFKQFMQICEEKALLPVLFKAMKEKVLINNPEELLMKCEKYLQETEFVEDQNPNLAIINPQYKYDLISLFTFSFGESMLRHVLSQMPPLDFKPDSIYFYSNVRKFLDYIEKNDKISQFFAALKVFNLIDCNLSVFRVANK